MKKIVLYCRVSSDDQKERDTIENQVETLTTYVEMKENLLLTNQYLDNGVSGTIPFEQRPAGKQLLEDATKKKFETVLVYKVDRFGRDTLSGLSAVELLRKQDIEIISLTEPFDLNTPIGRFQFTNYLNMAELERNNILDRMYIGATRAAKKGKWMGGITPYGYDVIDGYLEINEEEADVIRKIFELYAIGEFSSLGLAVYLNSLGIPSSCGSGKGKRTKGITGKWIASSIQRIIASTTYKGIHTYGKRGTRRTEPIEREVPAIISEELWDKAQEMKKINGMNSPRNTKNRIYLLKDLIECGHCGGKYYGITYKGRSTIYSCSSKRHSNKKIFGTNCDNLNLNAEDIEEQVINDIKYILKNNEELFEDAKVKNIGEDSESILIELNKLRKELNEKQNEKRNILSLFRKSIITESELDDQLSDIRKEEQQLEKMLAKKQGEIDIINNKNELLKNMRSIFDEYKNKIDNLSDEDLRNLVHILVKKIVVSTNLDDDGYRRSYVKITYNLVKLDDYTDNREDSMFDIHIERSIGSEPDKVSIGNKARYLRVSNNVSAETLAKAIGSSEITIYNLENDKIQYPYGYLKKICDYFNVYYLSYFEILNIKEETPQDKLIKIRALLGAKKWSDVEEYVKKGRPWRQDIMRGRVSPNSDMLLRELLKKLEEPQKRFF